MFFVGSYLAKSVFLSDLFQPSMLFCRIFFSLSVSLSDLFQSKVFFCRIFFGPRCYSVGSFLVKSVFLSDLFLKNVFLSDRSEKFRQNSNAEKKVPTK